MFGMLVVGFLVFFGVVLFLFFFFSQGETHRSNSSSSSSQGPSAGRGLAVSLFLLLIFLLALSASHSRSAMTFTEEFPAEREKREKNLRDKKQQMLEAQRRFIVAEFVLRFSDTYALNLFVLFLNWSFVQTLSRKRRKS